jgi:hypothetical protein
MFDLSDMKEQRTNRECPLCGAELDENLFCHNGDGPITDDLLEQVAKNLGGGEGRNSKTDFSLI